MATGHGVSAPRVTIVTSGHPSSCPRMVKAADAVAAAGLHVRFVSVDYIDWAAQFDTDLVARRQWQWTRVPLQRSIRPLASRWVSARQRAARSAVSVVSPARAPLNACVHAYARTHRELVRAILAEPFDFVYGGTVGALAAVAEAGRHRNVPFALDFEDYHPGESEEADASLTHALATRVVGHSIKGAAFTTTASAPMAKVYTQRFSVRPIVVHNVVGRPHTTPSGPTPAGRLRLYWFSQVIGPKRGLDDVVRAVTAAGVPAELHLRGVARPAYIAELRALAGGARAPFEIVVHPPAPPDEMVNLCLPFDVGVSPELEGVLNHVVCLANKPLTYLAAGLAVIATDTLGQRTLRDAAGDGIWWYRPGDVRRLAEGLSRWHRDRDALARARASSYRAAVERFHWEHPLERGALLEAIARVVS